MKKQLLRVVSLFLVIVLLAGCAPAAACEAYLNGVKLTDYTIVFDAAAPDYCQRAAAYIQQQILARTGAELMVCQTASGSYPHEIVVGQTDRPISGKLDAETSGLEFAILADAGHIALEGDYFVIAAAAYYFVQTYITGQTFQNTVPQQVQILTPITQEADNFIFLIGDGMGQLHTQMFSSMTPSESVPYTDGEDLFYGYMLPYQGVIRTNSLTGVTDSAAGATALTSGYKTYNRYICKDANGEDVTSLTELALSQGKSVGIMSTDRMVGATPSAFSAHALDRDDSTTISAFQKALIQEHGVILDCNLHGSKSYQDHISNTLSALEQNEKGFFLMYEEGHIDKFAAKNELQDTFDCMVRFNQAIGMFMEYAFYHPNTFVVITADHETGGLTQTDNGSFTFQTTEHTSANVPVFAYGEGAQAFDGFEEENTQVPKVIAQLWGVSDFGSNDS